MKSCFAAFWRSWISPERERRREAKDCWYTDSRDLARYGRVAGTARVLRARTDALGGGDARVSSGRELLHASDG